MKKTTLILVLCCLLLSLTACGGCKHEHTEVRGTIDATCTQAGYSGDTFCLDCSTTIQAGTEIAKGAHTLGAEPVGAFNPTCDLPGFMGNTYCSECGELAIKGKIVMPYGHTPSERKYVSEPECTREGYTGTIECKVCYAELEAGEIIPELGHSYDERQDVVEPSCTSAGSYTGVCSRCGRNENGIEIPKLDHVYENGFCTTCGWKETPGLYDGDALKYTWDQLISEGMIVLDESGNIEAFNSDLTGCLVIAEGCNLSSENQSDCFTGCSLSEIWFPGNIQWIGGLQDSAKLERIRYFGKDVIFGKGAFMNCTALKEIDIPTGMSSIADDCFYGCSALEVVNMITPVDNVGERAFMYCTSLKDFIFPLSSPDFQPRQYIEYCSFYGCTALEKVVLPKGLNEIGLQAFDECGNLTLYVRWTEEEAEAKYWHWFLPSKIPTVYGYTGE